MWKAINIEALIQMRRNTCFLILVGIIIAVNFYYIWLQTDRQIGYLPTQNFKRSDRSLGALARQNQLTIWSILRDLNHPQVDEFHETQVDWLEALHTKNSITAWIQLGVQVILFGEEAQCEYARTLLPPSQGICLPLPCMNEEYKVPQYDCLFAKASEVATTEFVMYANSDMIFFDDLLEALHKIANEYQDFLMVGQRLDIMYPRLIDFSNPNWKVDFKGYVEANGKQHGKYGIDYFLYRRIFTRKMPPFLVGRVRWDNWLLAEFIGGKDSYAIDTTGVITAVHLNHMKVGGSHLRTGTDYNINLTKDYFVDPKKIGDIESCDLRVVSANEKSKHGSCPDCVIKRNEQSLDVVLYKTHENRNLVVATVNYGYLHFAVNWLCSLRRLGMRNVLFHAADMEIYKALTDLGLAAFFYESDADREYKQQSGAENRAFDYGSVSYQGLMNTRTEFIYKILQKGYNVLLSDIDTIFLRNPFLFFDYTLDVQGGAHKQSKLTGGFIFFRSTEVARSVWVKVVLQHREMMKKIKELESFDPHSMTEQELLNQILSSNVVPDAKWGVIKENVVADGKRFFMDKTTQTNGEWPAVIHNNYIIGAGNKQQRFVNTSLWMVDENFKCVPLVPPLPAAPPKIENVRMTIKVLAFNRPKPLLRLLQSLDAADFMGDQVSLTFFIDYPNEEAAGDHQVLIDRGKVIKLAQAYRWKNGPKKVVVRKEHYGLANQWLNSWFPTDLSEVCLFLEDDNVLAPEGYIWLKKVIQNYYANPEQYDPRMYGISMQYQHMIAGNYPHRPDEFLPPGTRFYRYQLLSTWGPVFFPYHWSEFLTWYTERSSDNQFKPLFSNLITNQWFLARGGGRSVWSAWFLRFAGERGLYSLYTNFDNGASLLVNYRDRGVNYHEDKGPNAPMVEKLEPYMIDFPPLSEVPLYDFHFNQIVEDPVILEGRAIYADVYNTVFH